MAQLVELHKNADQIKNAGAEVIAVFREESKGVEGLKAIKKKTSVDFLLGLDTPAKKTARYSPAKMEFSSYVLDTKGTIRGIIKGDLRNRAKTEQLLKIVAKLSPAEDSDKSNHPSDDRTAVKRAVLDYVEGVYDVKPDLIERGVDSELKKFGFWRPSPDKPFNAGSKMTYRQLYDLSKTYNTQGRIPADAPKKIVVFDVMDRIATAKLDAAWGTDYFHLVKRDGQWKILQVVWQSPQG